MSQRAKRGHRNLEDEIEDLEEDVRGMFHNTRRSARGRIQNDTSSQPSTSRMSQSQNMNKSRAKTNKSQLDDNFLPNLTQSQRNNTNELCDEMLNNLIGNVIAYLLIMDKEKTVIARADIVKAALPEHSKYYKAIMQKVSAILKEVFGYNLVELPNSKYILTNTLPNPSSYLQVPNDRGDQILIFLALTHIFMSPDRKCTLENLFDFFKCLNIIDDNSFANQYFGHVSQLVKKKFVSQGYLTMETDDSDPPITYVKWGIRAEHELTPRRVLEFMSKMFGGCPLNKWYEPYKYMLEKEQAEEQ